MRFLRFMLAAASLSGFGSWGHAAPRGAKGPAQPRLPFPAPSVIPAASLNKRAQSAPVAAPVQARVQLEQIAAMPAQVAQAVRGGDAAAFYRACIESDYTPPKTDDAQQRLFYEGASLAAAYRISASRPLPAQAAPKPKSKTAAKPKAEKPRRPTKIDYETFGRLIAQTPLLSQDPVKHIEPKRHILAMAGYTHLYGPKPTRIPIALADDDRVGRAFANTLKAFRSYLKRQRRS